MKNTLSENPSSSATQTLSQAKTAESERASTLAPPQRTNYRKRQLSAVPSLNLPTDYPRPALPASRFESCALCVAADLRNLLPQFCRKEQVPLSAVVLSAFGALLHRYTSQEDILIGCALSDGVEGQAGNGSEHLHQFVVHTNLQGNPVFRGLLEDVTAQMIEAEAGDDISLGRSEQRSGPGSTGTIFRVAFSYRS